jgi:transcription elongation factor GreA
MSGPTPPEALPDRYLTPEQHARLEEDLAAIRRRQAELGAQIAETSDMFSGETEGNVLRDDLRWLMREEDRIGVMLRYPVIAEDDPRLAAGGDRVRQGMTVTVDLQGEHERFTIVNALEARPGAGLISAESPVGRALLGRRAGESVEVDSPAGRLIYRIVAIEG